MVIFYYNFFFFCKTKIELKFLHTSLSHSQRILQFLILPSSNQSISDVLVVYSEFVQIVQISLSRLNSEISIISTYPLEAPIVKCFLIGDKIGFVTNECFLIILECTNPYSLFLSCKLCDMILPSTAPIAHCVSCISNTSVLLSAFRSQIFNLELTHSEENPLNIFKITFDSSLIILSIVNTKDPNVFAFLVNDNSLSTIQSNSQPNIPSKKFVILYDVGENVELEKVSAPADAQSLVASFEYNENKTSFVHYILILSNHSVSLLESEIRQTTQCASRIHTCAPLPGRCFIFQFCEGEVCLFDPKKFIFHKKGKLPLVSKFYVLPNDSLLCLSSSADSFVIPLSLSGFVSKTSIELQNLPKKYFQKKQKLTTALFASSLTLSPTATKLTTKTNSLSTLSSSSLIAAYGSSDNTQIVRYLNTLPFVSKFLEEETSIFREKMSLLDDVNNRISNVVNDSIRLFAVNLKMQHSRSKLKSDSFTHTFLIASTRRYSMCLFSPSSLGRNTNFCISANATIVIKPFLDDFVQIHQKGLSCLVSGIEWNAQKSEVIAGDVGEHFIIIALKDSTVLLFDHNFQIQCEKEIKNLKDISFCDNFLAVTSNFQTYSARKSSLVIYSLELIPVYQQILLKSHAVSMVYNNETSTLFLSTMNGHILSWSFQSSNFNGSCSTIYTSSEPSFLFAFGCDLLIRNNKFLIYKDFQILPFTTEPINSLSVINDSTIIALTYNSSIIEISVDKSGNDLLIESIDTVPSTTRRITNYFYNSSYNYISISRSLSNSSSYINVHYNIITNESLYTNRIGDNVNMKSYEISDKSLTVVSFLTFISKPCLLVGFSKKVGNIEMGVISVMGINEKNGVPYQITSFDVPDVPYSMCRINSKHSSLNKNTIININNNINNNINTGNINNRNNNINNNNNINDSNKTENNSDKNSIKNNINNNDNNQNNNVNINEKEEDFVLIGIGKNLHILPTDDWYIQKREIASVPTQISFIEFSSKFVWIVDRVHSVFCFRHKLSEEEKIELELVATDSEPRQLTAICVVDDYRIAVGDKFGVITILSLSQDFLNGAEWGSTSISISHDDKSTAAKNFLMRIASFDVGQTITSIMKRNDTSTIFYTTLLGQIGALVPISSDVEFSLLSLAANCIREICINEFGFLFPKTSNCGNFAVVDLNNLSFIDFYNPDLQNLLEETTKIPFPQLMGLISRHKALSFF